VGGAVARGRRLLERIPRDHAPWRYDARILARDLGAVRARSVPRAAVELALRFGQIGAVVVAARNFRREAARTERIVAAAFTREDLEENEVDAGVVLQVDV